MKSNHKAQFLLLDATIIYGITPIILDEVLDYLSPLHAIAIRFGIAVLVFLLILPFFNWKTGTSFLSCKTCIFIGWLNAFGFLTATIGQKMTTVGLATLVSSSFIFIVPFIAWKLENNPLDFKKIVVTTVAFFGIFLIGFDGDWTNFSSISTIGIVFLLLAAIFWSFYIVISGKFLNKSKSNDQEVNMLSFIFAILFHTFLPLFFLSIFTPIPPISLPSIVILNLLFLGIFPTIIAFSLFCWAIARLGSVQTSFYLFLQVIVPFLIETLFIGQYYSEWTYCGIFIILISMFWVCTRDMSSSQENKVKTFLRTPQRIVPPIFQPTICKMVRGRELM
ncbi:MAG: DMT family transporter [Candidatus Hodarchaeota archaeon]